MGEWTQRHSEIWGEPRTKESWDTFLGCGSFGLTGCAAAPPPCEKCEVGRESSDFEEDMRYPSTLRYAATRTRANAGTYRTASPRPPIRRRHWELVDDEERCSIS